MDKPLHGRRILVTGGATGIGRAICVRLAREGAEVVVNCRTRLQEADQLVLEITRAGGTARVVRGDVTDPAKARALVEDLAGSGGVQGLVHAASAPLSENRFNRAEWESFEQHWQVSVKAAFNLAQAFVAQSELCRPESLVFLLSSVTFGTPPAEKSAYTTAKFALLGLARSLAVELAGRRIRVNCVSPGFAETSLTSHIDPRLKEMIARSVPLKRLASPDEIASAVAFLLNPENGYLTGINLPVTGGGAM